MLRANVEAWRSQDPTKKRNATGQPGASGRTVTESFGTRTFFLLLQNSVDKGPHNLFGQLSWGSAVFVIQLTFTLFGENNALPFLQRTFPSPLKPCGSGEMTLVLGDWVIRRFLVGDGQDSPSFIGETLWDSPALSRMLQSHNYFHNNTKMLFTFFTVVENTVSP